MQAMQSCYHSLLSCPSDKYFTNNRHRTNQGIWFVDGTTFESLMDREQITLGWSVKETNHSIFSEEREKSNLL